MDPPKKRIKQVSEKVLKQPNLKLFEALDRGNVVEVLKQDPTINVNERNRTNETCFFLACQRGDEETIKVLLRQPNIDVNAGVTYETPLLSLIRGYISVETKPYDIVDLLLSDERVDLNATLDNSWFGLTVLHHIIQGFYEGTPNFEIAKKLLCQKRKGRILNVNAKESTGNPAWSYYRNRGGYRNNFNDQSTEILHLIVQHESFKVNTTNSEGKTLLMMLIGDRFMADTITLLLKQPNIDLDVADNNGMTATHHFLHSLKSFPLSETENELIEVLLTERTINTKAVDKDGTTFLMQAVKMGCKELVQIILEKFNPDINSQDKKGNTAIMLTENDDIFLLLILHSPDINVMNQAWLTLLRKTMMAGKKTLAEKLLELESYDINQVQLDQLTDLMWLFQHPVQRGILTSMKIKEDYSLNWAIPLFLQHPKCDIMVTNKRNQSVFHLLHYFLDMLNNFVEHRSYNKEILNKQDRFGKTFLHNLCGAGMQVQLQNSPRDKIIKVLLKELKDPVVDLNLRDCAGNTPLMVAVQSQNALISALTLELLVEVPDKFDFTLYNKQQQSVLSIAKENNGLNAQILEILQANCPPEVAYHSSLSIPEQLKFLKRSVEQMTGLSRECVDDLVLLINNLKSQIEFYSQGNYQTFGMSVEHRSKLRGCTLLLRRDLETGELLPYLYQEEVISQSEKEEFAQAQSRTARVDKLLMLLPTRGPGAFHKLLIGLRETAQGHIADRLEKWEPSDSVTTNDTVGGMTVAVSNQARLAQLFQEVSHQMLNYQPQ